MHWQPPRRRQPRPLLPGHPQADLRLRRRLRRPSPLFGFAHQAENVSAGMSRVVMSGFEPGALPFYTALAGEFAFFDRWFASVPASTQPNPFYVRSATSHGASSNVLKDLIHGFPQKTIFDSIEENRMSFRIYYQNIPATLQEPAQAQERGEVPQLQADVQAPRQAGEAAQLCCGRAGRCSTGTTTILPTMWRWGRGL